MAYPTKDQIQRVTEAAACLVAATGDANTAYGFATLNQIAALAILHHEIEQVERDASFPLSGMAS